MKKKMRILVIVYPLEKVAIEVDQMGRLITDRIPEPNEYVNLFVDDIERKNTKTIELLFAGGSTNAMKCTATIDEY